MAPENFDEDPWTPGEPRSTSVARVVEERERRAGMDIRGKHSECGSGCRTRFLCRAGYVADVVERFR